MANLTNESRTKLAQAKSKGLTHTLMTEALTSGKCWEDIKDLCHLKICNSDIHTSVSHFMEIQQKEKESLAAYIHHFKREAMRCNFTNSAATMRIFVKGSQECPHISHLCLWKRTSDSSRCHKQSRETPDSAATISYLVTFIYSKCNVPWGRPMLSVSRVRSHHTSLPKCMLFWMGWIWSYSSGLSPPDTTLQHTCPSS